MDEQPPSPTYPTYPEQSTRAPDRTSPWVWVAIAISSLALLGVVGVGVSFVYFFSDFGGESGDYLVTQSSVEDAVSKPCKEMVDTAAGFRILGSRDDGAASLRNFTKAADGVVMAIDGADPDHDSKAWRKDWKTLIRAIEEFADQLEEDAADFQMPVTDGGYTLSERMFWGSPEGCEVPIVIEALDPQTAAEYYTYE